MSWLFLFPMRRHWVDFTKLWRTAFGVRRKFADSAEILQLPNSHFFQFHEHIIWGRICAEHIFVEKKILRKFIDSKILLCDNRLNNKIIYKNAMSKANKTQLGFLYTGNETEIFRDSLSRSSNIRNNRVFPWKWASLLGIFEFLITFYWIKSSDFRRIRLLQNYSESRTALYVLNYPF